MNRRFQTSIFAFATLFSVSTASAETIKTYLLVDSDGATAPVRIVWDDYPSLSTLTGEIEYDAGKVTFEGKNPMAGFISFTTEDGTKFELWRKQTEVQLIWEGKSHFDGHSKNIRMIPKSLYGGIDPSPDLKLEGARIKVTTRRYTTTASGVKSTAIIYWHNYKGLGAIDGEFRINDAVLKFEGKNARSGYLEFQDEDGRVFDLKKSRTSSGNTRWSGTVTAKNGDSVEIEMVDSE